MSKTQLRFLVAILAFPTTGCGIATAIVTTQQTVILDVQAYPNTSAEGVIVRAVLDPPGGSPASSAPASSAPVSAPDTVGWGVVGPRNEARVMFESSRMECMVIPFWRPIFPAPDWVRDRDCTIALEGGPLADKPQAFRMKLRAGEEFRGNDVRCTIRRVTRPALLRD